MPRGRGGVQLKAGAGFAESGPVHDLVTELWHASETNKEELVDKVLHTSLPLLHIILTRTGNESSDKANGQSAIGTNRHNIGSKVSRGAVPSAQQHGLFPGLFSTSFINMIIAMACN